jgi:hypothetical protein
MSQRVPALLSWQLLHANKRLSTIIAYVLSTLSVIYIHLNLDQWSKSNRR